MAEYDESDYPVVYFDDIIADLEWSMNRAESDEEKQEFQEEIDGINAGRKFQWNRWLSSSEMC